MLLTSALLICPMPSAEEEEVPDEEEQRFQADPFLVELARGLQCCFAGIPHAKELERQQNFLHSAQMARKLHIALPSNGLNMHLSLCSTNLLPEQNEVHFLSEFLFNGLPIRLKGQMNMQTLTGNAQVEHLSPLNAISRRQQSQAAGNGSRADNEPTDNNRDGQQRRERLQRRLAQLREAALRL